MRRESYRASPVRLLLIACRPNPSMSRVLLAGVLAQAGFATHARADEFYLAAGVIEGSVVEEAQATLTVQTESGVLQLPTAAVHRRVRGQTRMQRYADQRDAAALTPARHAELARWCLDQGLPTPAHEHLSEALAGNPQLPEALRLSGYVPFGELWIKANAPARSMAPPPARSASPDAIVHALSIEWHRRVNLLIDALTSRASDEQTVARARQQLGAIRSPLAIQPICKALGAGSFEERLLLIDLLAGFPEDEAALNSVVLALLDPERRLRENAATQLAALRGTRVRDFFLMALRCENDRLVRNAAQVLGWLGDRTAVGGLIDALPGGEAPGGWLSVKQLFAELGALFNEPAPLALGPQPAKLPPEVYAVDLPRTIERVSAEDPPGPALLRSEVQDALILLTGENFGFDAQAWRDWLARNPPLTAPVP